MPDRNKLQVYKEEGVKIARVCLTCTHATFRGSDVWGDCKKFSYSHARQDPRPRALPAHIAFTCPSWERSTNLTSTRELGSYANLLEVKDA